MKCILTLSILFSFHFAIAQSCKCDSVFLQVKTTVEENYAGWFDKVNASNQVDYQEWSEKHLLLSKEIANDSLCHRNLKNWIGYFKDYHLKVRFIQPRKQVQELETAEAPVEIKSTNLNEKQINAYLTKTKKLDPIEGIYESSSYKLGITKATKGTFYATIITTTNENWKPGEVKLIIEKKGQSYEGTFFEGDKSDKSQHPVKVLDNILDFDIVFYEKTFPKPKAERDITEYQIQKDDQAPKLDFSNPNLAVFTFPNFYGDSYEQLEFLLSKYAQKLKTTPYWVIDLRDNDGGDYRVGMQLLPYLYTRPILQYNGEMRMTESNFTMWYNSFVKDTYESADADLQGQFDALFMQMKASYGKMFNQSGTIADTLKLEAVLPYPQKVAILINENTVSSGELFTMIARQSDKVRVFGSNSGGMMDYGNIVSYSTGCNFIKLILPMDRQMWLDTGFSVDKEGLKPDVYLKKEESNWVELARKKITE